MSAALDVLAGRARYGVDHAECDQWLPSLGDRCVDLVFFSPPYGAQRTYSCGFKLTGQAWVDWLRPIVAQCCRVSAGLVCVNMAAPVQDHSYRPWVEWLVTDLTRLDGVACGPSPFAWVKSEDRPDAPGNGQMGSGGPRYQRRDWEPVYSFALPDRLPLAWSDNTAFGRVPLYDAGGNPSHRGVDGSRKKCRRAPSRGDQMEVQEYRVPDVSNPGNVIVAPPPSSDVVRAPVGGGKLGSRLAHESVAPMSLAVAERFVCWYCRPDGVVLDPFAGSGTTLHAAKAHGRRGIGCDRDARMVGVANRRLSGVTPTLFAGV